MSYPTRLLGDDESVVMEFRPHWSRIVKELVLSIAVLILLFLIATVLDFDYRAWFGVGLVVVWLLLVARGVLVWWFTQHVITDERLIYRAGVLSRHGKEIPLEVINDVSFDQSLWERMIGSGDLLIESAGELGQSHYRDIPHPERLQTVIYDARERRILALEGRSGATITRVQQLEILSRLHDAGKLTDQEYAAEKQALTEGADS